MFYRILNMRKCGYIALIGRANVGKSTLLNYILDQKVSITSNKPQTTRFQITGIKTKDITQFIYIDTPGIQTKINRKIDKFMNKQATDIIKAAHIILLVIEIGKWTRVEETIISKIESYDMNTPIFLVLNKADKINSNKIFESFIDNIVSEHTFVEVIIVSAKHGHGIKILEDKIAYCLPENDFFYPKELITSRREEDITADIIREKLIRNLGQEVPYQLTVLVEKFENNIKNNHLDINALILVERLGQKTMIIGSNGLKLKKIGMLARHDIEKTFQRKIYLKLWVKVKKNWSDDLTSLNLLGYNNFT